MLECGKNRPWSLLIDTLLFSGSMEENDESHKEHGNVECFIDNA